MEENQIGNSIFKFERDAGIDSKMGNWRLRTKELREAEEKRVAEEKTKKYFLANNKNFSEIANNIVKQNAEIKIERLKEYYDQIIKDDGELLIVDDLTNEIYKKLLNFQVPEKGIERLKKIDGRVQYISGNDKLQSKKVNMDYFSVRIDKMPSFVEGSPELDVNVLYRKIRENFLILSKGSVIFEAYCDILGDNTIEGKWEFMPYPKTASTELERWKNQVCFAIFKIEAGGDIKATLAGDHGAVLESECLPFERSWIFTTVYTPESDTQPFSGHRQFGIHKDDEGNYRFFARAIDRIWPSEFISYMNGKECAVNDYLTIADATWNNLIKNVSDFVKKNGGKTTIMPAETKRIDFNIFFKKFKNDKPVNFVGNVNQYKK